LWDGKRDSSISLVKWTCISMPKELGGWGIENLNWLCNSLATKSLWRMINNSSLWGRVIKYKYIRNISIWDWFISLNNLSNINSISWKATVEVFPMIGNWAFWKVGNGKRVHIGEDTWFSVDPSFNLSRECIEALYDQGVYSLWDENIADKNFLGKSSWKSTSDFLLTCNLTIEWKKYVENIFERFIIPK
jgi:hypothetical protein